MSDINGHWIYDLAENRFTILRIWFEKKYRKREWCWYHKKWELEDGLLPYREVNKHNAEISDYFSRIYDDTSVYG
jgi:hypothetical protein